jgi:uncharacterized protein YbjT (DUF2867 family)
MHNSHLHPSMRDVMKIALIAGSTGLVGTHLLKLLLDSPHYERVKAIARRPLKITHPKLDVILADYKSLRDVESRLEAHDVFCCLGTTMKNARTKAAFEEVDLDYPFLLATLTSAKGAGHFALVSALSAHKDSMFYYNQIKGKAEEVIQKIPFRSIHIYRPSLLLGDRNESRPTEEAAKVVYKALDFIIPRRYKAIEGAVVASAMLHFARKEDSGIHIHSSAELQQFRDR